MQYGIKKGFCKETEGLKPQLRRRELRKSCVRCTDVHHVYEFVRAFDVRCRQNSDIHNFWNYHSTS